MVRDSRVPITRVDVSVYTVPTDAPESDGTLTWNATTIVIVEAYGGDQKGVGYTYTHAAAAALIRDKLAGQVTGADAMGVTHCWSKMVTDIRNLGRPGISSMAVAAVDVALWDLKARLLDLPLVTLLGAEWEAVPVYGSGGFTSYSVEQLQTQLQDWVNQGIERVKMKVGRDPIADRMRVGAARRAIRDTTELYVDANGAYDRKQALAMAQSFAEQRVTWLEEPVSSDDLEGLRLIRDRAPAGIEISAGEYGFSLPYFRRMLDAGAVDVLQADATRCAGITGFLGVAALCDAYLVPLSSHTAPALHVHPSCAVRRFRHLEYFHDHVRIETMFFDGIPTLVNGMLRPDLTRAGLGLELKTQDIKRYEG
jgi:L-alanine-DL-glutamate epimerase-like enolase superfamily enzyme